jgi:hypothetical protein
LLVLQRLYMEAHQRRGTFRIIETILVGSWAARESNEP